MKKFVFYLIAILVCHQITTIFTYFSLKREDRGLMNDSNSFFSNYLLPILLFIPFLGNAIYDMTIGLVDHLREKRLCMMLVERDDKIKALENKNKELSAEISCREKYEDFLKEISNKDFSHYSYLSFKQVEEYTNVDF